VSAIDRGSGVHCEPIVVVNDCGAIATDACVHPHRADDVTTEAPCEVMAVRAKSRIALERTRRYCAGSFNATDAVPPLSSKTSTASARAASSA
jgi:hypothetical protein